MDKRGLSGIVTTLMIILLVIVAVGIVWGVVKNLIDKESEDISFRNLVSLEVSKVKVNENGVDVTVKMGSDDVEIKGIKFIISDGVDTKTFDETYSLNSLESHTFNLDYSGLVKSVEIAPVFLTEKGKEKTGSVAGKKEFTNKETVENIPGLVSWWRFEGNAQDEVGENDGTVEGGVSFVDGKYGQAASFDGVDGSVEISNYNGNGNSDELTVIAQINRLDPIPPNGYVVVGEGSNYYVQIRKYAGSGSKIAFWHNSAYLWFESNTNVLSNKWSQVAITFDKSLTSQNLKFYLDGIQDGTGNIQDDLTPSQNNLKIGLVGSSRYFNGLIDEVMIFNRALSEEEIKALYELEL